MSLKSIHKKITPSNNLKKCQVQTTSGTKKCIEVDKACEDFTDKTCFNLNVGSDKRCVLLNGKCEEHYNSDKINAVILGHLEALEK